MTLRKTLIGALASILLLVGFAGQAVAQDDTGNDAGSDTTQTDTTTDTSTDTTGTDTSTDTTTDTSTEATSESDASATAEAADTTGDSAVTGQGEASIADAFATEAPNPQPGAPAAVDDAAAQAAPAAADEVLGESELAFTGPDTRVMALAMVLLGAGALFVVASRRQEEELVSIEAWLD